MSNDNEKTEDANANPISDSVTSLGEDDDDADQHEQLIVPKEVQLKAKDLLKMLGHPTEVKNNVCVGEKIAKSTPAKQGADDRPKVPGRIQVAKIKEPGPSPSKTNVEGIKKALSAPQFINDAPKVGKTKPERLRLRKILFSKLPPATDAKLPTVEKIEAKPEMDGKSRKEVPSWILDVLDHGCSEDTLKNLSRGKLDRHDLQVLKRKQKKLKQIKK